MEWPLLAGLPPEEVRQVLSIARRRRFSKGEVVFHQHDPGDSLHLVSKGRFVVRVMTPLADVATIAIRGAGASFGEMALVDGSAKRSATVSALEEGETFAVYQTDFARLRRDFPSVDQVLIAFLANEVRMLNGRLLEALYLPVDKRVRRRLVELAEQYPDDGGALIALTQEAIAELAGAARATVNQVLREEEERGTIELQRGKTRVLDLEQLRKRAR
jgi:CRP/FNR family cyclic AMP-dependent transcriptional regulator